MDSGIISSIDAQRHYLSGANLAQITSSDTAISAKQKRDGVTIKYTQGGKKGVSLREAQEKGIGKVYRQLHQFFPENLSCRDIIEKAAESLSHALSGSKGSVSSYHNNLRFDTILDEDEPFKITGYYQKINEHDFSILTFFPSLDLPYEVFLSRTFLTKGDVRVEVLDLMMTKNKSQNKCPQRSRFGVIKGEKLKKIIPVDQRKGERFLEVFRSFKNGIKFEIPLKTLIGDLANFKDGCEDGESREKAFKILFKSKYLPSEQIRKELNQTHGVFRRNLSDRECVESYIMACINSFSLGNKLLILWLERALENSDCINLEDLHVGNSGLTILIDIIQDKIEHNGSYKYTRNYAGILVSRRVEDSRDEFIEGVDLFKIAVTGIPKNDKYFGKNMNNKNIKLSLELSLGNDFNSEKLGYLETLPTWKFLISTFLNFNPFAVNSDYLKSTPMISNLTLH